MNGTRRESWCARGVRHFMGQVENGRIDFVYPDGAREILGREDAQPQVDLVIHDPRFFVRTALGGDIGFGESFMLGEWSCHDLPALLALLSRLDGRKNNRRVFKLSAWTRFFGRLQHRLSPNSLAGSRANIEAHYDLGNEFFATFLDATMLYSCALYDHPGQDLEQAQRNKVHALLRKAEVTASDHVLEIGTGWGGFAIEAARTAGCKVTTITISEQQASLARKRVDEAGLADRVEVRVNDYREVSGRFDKIVSIEMLEAVGHRYLGTFFRACDNLLKPGGLVALQVITIPDQRYHAYRRGCDWIQKHIFPGGLCPSLSAMRTAMSRHSSLVIDQVEAIGDHYVTTLGIWRESFSRNLDKIRGLGFNEVFQRKWLYYLSYCEAGFATGQIDDHHVVLRRPPPG